MENEMDTPERARLENSPVFSFISNLSPIKHVKSVHITQTLNSLSFSSPPSVFTSPHVNCNEESRFLRRHNLLGPSKPNVSSEDVNKISSHEEAPTDSTHACHDSIETSSEHIELPQALNYNSGSLGYDPLLCGDEANFLHEEAPTDSTHACHGSIETSSEHIELPQALNYNSGSLGYDPLLCGDEANSLHEEAPTDSTHACHDSIETSSEHIELPQALNYNSGSLGYDPLLCGDEANSLHEEAPTDSTHACHDSIETSNEHIELPQALNYNSGSLGYDPLLCGDEANSLLELPGKPASDVSYVQEGLKNVSVDGETHLQAFCQREAKIEGPDSDLDTLITYASDLLIFRSPNVPQALEGLMNKQLDPSIPHRNFMTLLPQSTANNGHEMHVVNPVASGSEHEIVDFPSEPIAATDAGQTQDNLANVALMASNPSEKVDNQVVYVTHPRRSLDFEMASVQRKNTGDSSNIYSSAARSDERDVGNMKQTGDSGKGVLPRIGLHLNALATLKHYRSIKGEMVSSERQPNLPSSTSLHLPPNQEHHLSSVPPSMERDLEPSKNEVQPAENCTQSSVYMAGEDFHQNSPKKKRRKLESAGEGESCKRCNCKKSKCLKLYCECFAAGVFCKEPCLCQDCFNKPNHEDLVTQTRKQILSRNPLAFAPKVIRSSDSAPGIGEPNRTPDSARHKRGCNCKKSSCLKKYCECYQGGVGCSVSCRCEGCKNTYGRKDGSPPAERVVAETEEETKAYEKGVVERASQKTEIQNINDRPDCALPTTPSQLSRSLLPLPFDASKGKHPRSFVTTIPSSGIFGIGNSNAFRFEPKFEKALETVPDDDSPITCIKTSSPNGKRISSLNCASGSSSPTRRGSTKMILQSIPPFPSLTHHHQ